MIPRNNLKQIILESKHRDFPSGIPRDLAPVIEKNLGVREIIAVTGIRRCGKTTLMYQFIEKINRPDNVLYINFEDERLIQFDVNDFERLLEVFYEMNSPEGRIYLFLDEIQEIFHWEKWVRRTYDASKNIKFFITGSSSALLSSEFANLLTGRNLSYVLYPFSFREYLAYHNSCYTLEEIVVHTRTRAQVMKYLQEYIKYGGFPAVAEHYRIDLLQQYFRDILYRDIVKRYQVRDVKLLEELYVYLLTNTANLYSFNNLKNTFNMGLDTVKEYIRYGISANLLYDHLFFSYSLKQSFQKNRKMYAVDPGLRNAVAFTFSEDLGRLVENVVFLELQRNAADVYYYSDKHELDFIVKRRDNSLVLINVCYTDHIPDRELQGFHEFQRTYDHHIARKMIITEDYEDTIDDIECIPLWKWLLVNCPV